MSNVVSKVTEAVTPIVEQLGYELVEVTYASRYGNMELTIFIHSPNGVSLDDCERVHYAVDPILDELNPTNDAPYVLNISSSGLDRPIVSDRDYNRALGQEVEVKLKTPIDKKNVLEAVLDGYDEEYAHLTLLKGKKPIKVARSNIALMTILIKF